MQSASQQCGTYVTRLCLKYSSLALRIPRSFTSPPSVAPSLSPPSFPSRDPGVFRALWSALSSTRTFPGDLIWAYSFTDLLCDSDLNSDLVLGLQVQYLRLTSNKLVRLTMYKIKLLPLLFQHFSSSDSPLVLVNTNTIHSVTLLFCSRDAISLFTSFVVQTSKDRINQTTSTTSFANIQIPSVCQDYAGLRVFAFSFGSVNLILLTSVVLTHLLRSEVPHPQGPPLTAISETVPPSVAPCRSQWLCSGLFFLIALIAICN